MGNALALPPSAARREADDAVELARTNPRRAIALATAAVSEGETHRDWSVVSTAERALGLAARELRDIGGALGASAPRGCGGRASTTSRLRRRKGG